MSNIHKYNSKGELVEPWEEGYYSVTTILDVRHKQKLWDWKLRVGWEVANDKMLDSQERGKAIHKALETINQDESILADVSPEAVPFCEGYLRWYDKFEPDVVAREMYLVSERHKYAGTADLICLIDEVLWIVDFKTGSKSIDHGLQLAAYRQAYKEMTGHKARTACLYLTDKTKRGWSWKEYKEPVNTFLAAKKLFDWQVSKEPFKKPQTDANYTGGMLYVPEA